MPEIEFRIDTETGKCETEIRGFRGPVCERAAQQIKELLGTPSVDEKTKEYFEAAVQNLPQLKRKANR